MTDSFAMGTPITPTVADVTDPIKATQEPLVSVMQPVIQQKAPEQILNDTVQDYVHEALKWFQLPENEENIKRVYSHLSKLIGSMKDF